MDGLKSILRTVHGYSGAVLAIAFFILGLSGAAIVFEDEMLKAAHPELSGHADVASVEPMVAAIIDEIGATRIAGVKTPTAHFAGYKVGLKNGRTLLYDQHGNRVGAVDKFSSVPATLVELHHNWLTGKPGKILNGVLAFCLFSFVFSGLILWTRRGFKWRYFKPKSFSPPEMHGLHRNLGILLSPFLALTALTAFAIVFSPQVAPVLGRLAPMGNANAVQAVTADSGSLIDAMRAASATFPDAAIVQVQPAGKPGAVHKISMKAPGEIAYKGFTRVYVSSDDGSITFARDALKGAWNEKLMESLLPIHSGHTGWIGHRFFNAFVGLALSALAVAGFTSFWRRRLRARRK
ncbi:MAG: PepSY-associated TM helix domain-containing protein [Parvularculaceae bacterium]